MIERFLDHAANERTYLSWIRTAIATAGFGMVVERLPKAPEGSELGIILVGVSAALVLSASVRFLLVRRQIRQQAQGNRLFALVEVLFAIMLALLLLSVFVFMLGLLQV